MRNWQIQEAKNKLSELLRCAEVEGPQVITWHGQDRAVVISAEDYRRIAKPESRKDLTALLLGGPKVADLELQAADLKPRDVDF
ncbi:MAG: type II toxin-antitoxin system Phd/YefM family antitoxin [Sphingomonadales bacterium]